VLFALTASANATVPDKRISRRAQRQELSLEDRLEGEQRLSNLGYWTGPIDGMLDPAFRHALIAFQKIEGRQRIGVLTKDDLEAIRTAKKPLPRQTGDAHIEIDLDRQVLFMVDASG
jgi:peptidoglycan hydrolase-like protein with peptidoglycan-binding domain